MEVEHSRLLKFFTEGRAGPKMADPPAITIEKDYQSPPNVKAEVPGTHKIREPNAECGQDTTNTNTSEFQITGTEFTLSPVMTVTKKESSFTKGDLKLQKVTVTEDIAMEEIENGGHRVSREEQSLRQVVRQTSSRTEVRSERIETRTNEGEMEREERSQNEKKSKIPIMRFKQAAEKVRKERETLRTRNQPRRSSIPKLKKDANKAIQRGTSLKSEPKVEDEFEKIYEATVDVKHKEIDAKLLTVPIEDTEKIESKFEEIIQSYDEDEQEKHTVSRVSKIPALRRRGDDRSSKFGSLVDTIKEKNTVTETKLKDGGFKVTASTIRTKRFSRGNSRDLSKEEPKVEVTETIDIKERGDSEFFARQTVSKAPVKPKRSIGNVGKQINNDGRKIDITETIRTTTHGFIENIDTVTTVKDTGVKSKKDTHVTTKELRSDGHDIDITKRIEELKNTTGVETVSVKEFEDGETRVITTKTVRENVQVTPVKTRRTVRGISREISENSHTTECITSSTNGGNTETMTVEEFNDGGGRTITTTTTVRESVKIGTPVITETIVRNISRGMSSESETVDVKDNNNQNTVTIEEIVDEDSDRIIKKAETVEEDNIPMVTERFTRGFSKEMGNIKHRGNTDVVTIKEVKGDNSHTKTKNTITKENVQVSSPTKTERIAYSINQQIKDNHADIRRTKNTAVEETKTQVKHQITKEKFVDKNINASTSVQNAIDTKKEIIMAGDTKEIIKKETMETEKIVKEGIKVGIPVFTKVTQSFSKGKIQNVEISKTIEWKPPDELKTKSYTRSVSEKVTRKELKDAKDWEFEPPIPEITNNIDKPKVRDDIVVNKNETPTDPVTERKIKDTVKDIATKIAVKKMTEYNAQEQTTTEKSTYTFSKSVDLSLNRDFKDFKDSDLKAEQKTSSEEDKTQYSKENKNNTSVLTSVTNKSEMEYKNLSKQEKDEEAVTVLKGNVNRLKDMIAKENTVVSKKENVEGIPKEKKKSILSKIAMFERLEPNEPEFKKLPIKCKYVAKERYSERPKIVDEILKDQSNDIINETSKVEIGVNYDEVTYINDPVIVKEYWKTEEGSGQNVSTINRVVTEKTMTFQTMESKNSDSDMEVKTLPQIIDFKSNESQIKHMKASLTQTSIEENVNQFEVATSPEKNIFDDYQATENTENIINKNKIKIIDNEYEADIGKSKPGKIDLYIWKNQVAVNKALLDKIDVTRGENSKEIANASPGNVGIKIYESHVQVSKVLPETIDFKKDETKFQYTKPLPSIIEPEIKEIGFDIVRFLPENNYSKNHDEEEVSSPHQNNFKVHDNKVEVTKAEAKNIDEVSMEIAKPLRRKNDFTAKEIELPKILPDKKEYLRPRSYIESIETSQNESGGTKPAPGKLNLNLWKNQVETNKSFVGQISSNTNKDIEAPIEIPGRVNFNGYEKQVEISKTAHGKLDFYNTENKLEIVKIEADSIESRVETADILPATMEFSAIDNQFEIIQTLPEIIDVSNTEHQAETVEMPDIIEFNNRDHFEVITTLPSNFNISTENHIEKPGNIINKSKQGEAYQTSIEFETSESQIKTIQHNAYHSSTENKRVCVNPSPEKTTLNTHENKIEVSKPLPGRLDLKAWENQVEANKSLVDKIDVVRSENLNQLAKTLPGNINLSVHERKMQIPKPLLADGYLKKLEIPVESAHTESFSDPELVDEQESNFNNTNSLIINKMSNDMYFNEDIVQHSSDKAVNKASEGKLIEENDYERKVEKLLTKTYSISEIGRQTITQDKTIRTVSDLNTCDSKYNEIIKENQKEGHVENYKNITKEYELNTNSHTAENNITIEVIQTSVHDNNVDEYETNENEFSYDVSKVHNEMSRSTYGAEDFKMTNDVKRARSLAELDLGDVINGTVQRMVGRMKSLDFDRRDSVKTEKISLKEMPKKLSVWEKIALFEGKASSTRTESATIRSKVTKKNETLVIPEEVYLQKIEELTNAKTKFGRMDEMLYLHLANEKEMPVISLGTALVDKRLLPHVIGAAIDMGYRAFDTAYIYDNEKEIGQAIKAKIVDGTVRREDLFITSKLWSTFHRTDLVEEACRASLNNLGLDYFDLYLIHNPMSFKEGADSFPKIATVLQYSDSDYLDAWYGMEGLVSNGLARSIGLSNFNSQQIQRILDKGKLKPMVNQVECHPYLSQQRLDAFCTERDITLSCFGVLGSKGTPAEYKSSVSPVIDDPLVKVMASGLGVSPAQLLIRYQIECGHNVVVKSSSAAHLWDNLQALTFTLDPSQVEALHALNRNKRIFTFAGMGDTHKNYPFLAPF